MRNEDENTRSRLLRLFDHVSADDVLDQRLPTLIATAPHNPELRRITTGVSQTLSRERVCIPPGQIRETHGNVRTRDPPQRSVSQIGEVANDSAEALNRTVGEAPEPPQQGLQRKRN
jgi:hypothetical protein